MSQENVETITRLYDEFLAGRNACPIRGSSSSSIQPLRSDRAHPCSGPRGRSTVTTAWRAAGGRRSRCSGTSTGCPYDSSTAAITSWPPSRHVGTASTATMQVNERVAHAGASGRTIARWPDSGPTPAVRQQVAARAERRSAVPARAGEGTRTPDIRFTRAVLYQLSYSGLQKSLDGHQRGRSV